MKIIANVLVLFIGWGMPLVVDASPILNSPSLWNQAAAGWGVVELQYSDSDGPVVLGPGSSGTTAEILFTDGGFAPRGELYATSGNFVGNLQNPELIVNFTFTSVDTPPNQTPGSFAVFFQAVGGARWYFDLTPPTAVGTTQYSVFMGSQGSWTPFNGATDFWSDLGIVDRFGFEIVGGQTPGVDQRYRFSDVYFSIPEPETVWMILMVVACLVITFRSRMAEILGELKARIKK